MNILKSLKNTKGKVFNFFGYENKVKIKFPFVTLVYSILYIIFNVINKNAENEDPVKFYEYLKDKKIRYLFLYIQSIGDGMFIYFPKNKVGNLILHLLYLVTVSLIVEFLVGHKKILLYILVAIFAGYFTILQKYYLLNVTYEFRTKPYCCGSMIYTFFGGVGISTLFSKMNNYKGKLLAFIMFLLVLFIQSYSDYKITQKYNKENRINHEKWINDYVKRYLNNEPGTIIDKSFLDENSGNIFIIYMHDTYWEPMNIDFENRKFSEINTEYLDKRFKVKVKAPYIFVFHAHMYLMGIVVGLLNNTIKF